MDPQQEIFTELLLRIKALGYDVFDGELPPENTPYPFVYLGDMQQTDRNTKTEVIGSTFPSIHIWHSSPKKRGTVSKMLREIKLVCRRIEKTKNYSWFVKNMNQRIITDTTIKTPLLHGILEVEFAFS